MKLLIALAHAYCALAQLNVFDTTAMLSQYGDGSRVLSSSSRDLLKQFQLDLDDLSARMGATTFGRAETVDQKLFRELRCCEPEIPFDASLVSTTASASEQTAEKPATDQSSSSNQAK